MMNINLSTTESSISKTLNLSASGDVWFSSIPTQTVGDTFETEIYVDTNSQSLATYGLRIVYNESVIQIASVNDVIAGAEGFVSTVNVDNANGFVTIIGIDEMGVDPSSQLHLLTINWSAVDAGTSSLDLTIDTLSDIDFFDIGTPNAIDSSVEVKEPPQAPVLSFPVAFYYREGTTGHSITWIAIDDNPTTYNITRIKMPDYQNVIQVASGSYSSGDSITITVDGLLVGTYHYTCTVYDGDGLSKLTMTMVKVVPKRGGNVWFSSVSTQTVGDIFETEIYVNTSNQKLAGYGFDIRWNQNILNVQGGYDGITAGADGFLPYAIVDNNAGTMMLTGFDPNGVGPNNQLHLLTITWIAIGIGNSPLNLFIDDLLDTDLNTLGIPQDFDASVEVEDIPTQAPVLNSPANVSYQEGETGNSITWIATDYNPTTYTITQNDTQEASGSWSSDNPITINVDGLSFGLYIYIITVNDGSGNNATDSVYVLVYKVPEPPGGGEIPGYDLFIFLGSLWITVLAMIYLRRRR